MNSLHFPGLEISIALPLIGAAIVYFVRVPERAQLISVWISAITLFAAAGASIDFGTLGSHAAHDRWDLSAALLGYDLFVIDELSSPLIPLAALLYLATNVATLGAKVRRYSFAGNLASESVLLATLSCRDAWMIIALLLIATVFPYWELRARKKPTRVYVLHMGLFAGLLVFGQLMAEVSKDYPHMSLVATALLTLAVLIRSGVCPVHCWMTDLFENASFGTALLFITPMIGAYAAVHLVLPTAPVWALRTIAIASVCTAVYSAGMALVQRDARRFFCYLLLSHSSLVLVGLEIATPIGLTGALSVWVSVGLALSGFGLTLRSMEARLGRISLTRFHGMYEHTPMLAAFFLLTGLASVGFPGTFGFVGTELLIDGVVEAYPLVGFAVVIAAALNGIAVLQAYFRVFTGSRHYATISLRSRLPERAAVLTLAALIIGGGLLPQPGITSRYHAAQELLRSRNVSLHAQQAKLSSATGQDPVIKTSHAAESNVLWPSSSTPGNTSGTTPSVSNETDENPKGVRLRL